MSSVLDGIRWKCLPDIQLKELRAQLTIKIGSSWGELSTKNQQGLQSESRGAPTFNTEEDLPAKETEKA